MDGNVVMRNDMNRRVARRVAMLPIVAELADTTPLRTVAGSTAIAESTTSGPSCSGVSPAVCG